MVFLTIILSHGYVMITVNGFSGLTYMLGFIALSWIYVIMNLYAESISDARALATVMKNISWLFCGLVALSYLQWFSGISPSPRPSFIGVEDGFSDAHLLSNLTALLWAGIAFTSLINKELSYHFALLTLVVGICLIFNGSRNGLLIYVISLALFFLNLPGIKLKLALCILVGVTSLAIIIYLETSYGVSSDLVQRALFKGIFSGEDVSVAARLEGLGRVVGSDDNSLLLGKGLFSLKFGFFDGGITLWLNLFGIIGLMALFLFVSQSLVVMYLNGYKYSLYISFLLGISFLITEFFITPRGMLIYCLVFFSVYRVEYLAKMRL